MDNDESADENKKAIIAYVNQLNKEYTDYAGVILYCFRYRQLVNMAESLAYKSEEGDFVFKTVIHLIETHILCLVHRQEWSAKKCNCYYNSDMHFLRSRAWTNSAYFVDMAKFCLQNKILFITDAESSEQLLCALIDRNDVVEKDALTFLVEFRETFPTFTLRRHAFISGRISKSAALLNFALESGLLKLEDDPANTNITEETLLKDLQEMEKNGRNVKAHRDIIMSHRLRNSASISKETKRSISSNISTVVSHSIGDI